MEKIDKKEKKKKQRKKTAITDKIASTQCSYASNWDKAFRSAFAVHLIPLHTYGNTDFA